MREDPLADLAARLFEAAREEPLPHGAMERALVAATRARREPASVTFLPRHWAALSLGLAVAASFMLALWPSRAPERPTGISAEPTSVADKAAKPKTEPALPAPSASAASIKSAAPFPLRAAPSAAPSHTPAAATLGDELEALKRAETALGNADAKAALEALDRYDQVLHGRQLRAEASLLRMDALSRSGHADQAAALAARFVTENPGSPLVDRARSFMTRSPAPTPEGP